MAGRGRGKTLPAWMTQGGGEGNGAAPQGGGGAGVAPPAGPPPPQQAYGGQGPTGFQQNERPPPDPQNYGGEDAQPQGQGGGRDFGGQQQYDQGGDNRTGGDGGGGGGGGGRGGRGRDWGGGGGGGRDRRGGGGGGGGGGRYDDDRYDDRGGGGGRRRDRSRGRDRRGGGGGRGGGRRDRGGGGYGGDDRYGDDRYGGGGDRSRSRDRRGGGGGDRGGDGGRRRKRRSNFDVRPPGFEGLPTGDAAANLLAAQAFLEQQKAAAGGAPSGGPPPGAPGGGGGGSLALLGALGAPRPGLGLGAPPPPGGGGGGGGGAGMGGGGGGGGVNQQTRHARRLYVGGVQGISEEDLKAFFNQTIDRALRAPQPGGAVLSVYINLERAFAFVELPTIELATACMALDGLRFRGLQLKIRRPSDYNPALLPPSGPLPQLDLSALGVISSQVQDGPNKIFIGGLPYHLADEQVRELLTAFGALKAFHLVREPGSATSKGYGFCEYQEPSVTVKACAGLNGMALGDKTLTVKMATNKAQGGGPMPHAHVAQANAAAAAGLLAAPPPMMLLPGMMGGAPGAVAGGGGFSVAGALQAALAGGGGPGAGGPPSAPATAAQGALAAAMPPTRVLVLLNMVSPGDLGDPGEYRDILEDVRDEAAKHGQVLRVVIPRPGDPGLRSPAAVGKAYVEFAAPHFAQAAAVALAGRQFGQRVVRIEYFDENKFAAGHLE